MTCLHGQVARLATGSGDGKATPGPARLRGTKTIYLPDWDLQLRAFLPCCSAIYQYILFCSIAIASSFKGWWCQRAPLAGVVTAAMYKHTLFSSLHYDRNSLWRCVYCLSNIMG